MKGILIFVALLLAGGAVPADAAEALVLKLDGATVDWTRGKVLTTGVGGQREDRQDDAEARRLAVVQARAEARERLIAAVQKLPVDGTRQVADVIAGNADMLANLRRMVADAPVVKQSFRSDGSVAVALEFSLFGGFAQMVLPTDIRQVEPIRPVGSPAQADDSPKPGGAGPPGNTDGHTGLLIDARGTGLNPALVLHVWDQKGQPVYGPAFVSREHAVQAGLCTYTLSLEVGRKDKRLGAHPLVVKAVQVYGNTSRQIVISNTDAKLLRSESGHLDFLRRCRVAVVTDPPPKAKK